MIRKALLLVLALWVACAMVMVTAIAIFLLGTGLGYSIAWPWRPLMAECGVGFLLTEILVVLLVIENFIPKQPVVRPTVRSNPRRDADRGRA